MGSRSRGVSLDVHSRQGNHAFGDVDGEVADAFQVIGDFLGGHDAADFLVIQQAGAQHAHGVVVDQNFHLIDARLDQENLAGEFGGCFQIGAQQCIERALDAALDGAGHGNQIIG